MSDSRESMSVQEIKENLSDLLRLVSQRKKRIQIRDGSSEPCLLISLAEVEALEQAIRILADTAEVKALCTSFSALATATDQPAMA